MTTAPYSSSEQDEWVKPEDLLAWQSIVYRKMYNAGSNSYALHYSAALRGNRISVARMEAAVSAFALARLRGVLTTK